MSQIVVVAMVARGTEIDIGTFGTFPADPVEGRGVAAITSYTIVFDT